MGFAYPTPTGVYGVVPAAPSSLVPPALAKSAGPGLDDATRSFHPDSPVFWAVAITLVTVGLIGAASSFRIGPLKASVSAGKS